ncbi:MAG: ATPase [Alphaproteobacteria bacterium]|nr:ATPase [Alphaproteobacteria bacterium SS10]
MKRFYKQAGLGEDAGGLLVQLDGRTVMTPTKQPLTVPSKSLADAMVAEWDGQGDEVDMASMPMTGLGFAVIDHVAPNRDGIIAQIRGYAETELLCHFDDRDQALIARQNECWKPVLDWAAEGLKLPLKPTAGIMPVTQDPDVVSGYGKHLEGFDDWHLTAVSQAVGLTGSILLGLAMVTREIDADAAHQASLVDELYQAERWGSDEEAETRRANLRADLEMTRRFTDLLDEI